MYHSAWHMHKTILARTHEDAWAHTQPPYYSIASGQSIRTADGAQHPPV